MYAVMNNTKWIELQTAMLNMQSNIPKWRVGNIANDYVSDWDGEWYYHFSEGGFENIKWVEIMVASEDRKAEMLSILQTINLPGCETENGFKIYGYINNGDAVNYL